MALLLIGASPNILRAGQAASTRVLIVDRTAPDLLTVLRGEDDQFYLVDYHDLAAVDAFADVLTVGPRPTAVASVTEQGLIPAARLVDRLGLRGPGEDVVRSTRDKRRMRARLAAHAPHLSLPSAPGTDREAVAQILKDAGQAVLKPALGTASQGIRRLQSLDDLDRLPEDERRDALVEAFAPGTEVSVESLSVGGEHRIVCIAEKRISPGFVEVAHLTPPPSLTGADVARVTRATAELLDALGITDGPAHTELMVCPERVTVIETHNRPGGDGIVDLAEATTGIDWRRASLAWSLVPDGSGPGAVDDVLRDCTGPAVAGAAAIVFFTAPPGTVTRVLERPERVGAAKTVNWRVEPQVGTQVGPLRDSFGRLGATVLHAPDAQALRDAVEHLLTVGVIEVTEGSAA
ncbi:ATP-grasp domain-containing protein [Micromonospora auratinigra]|uniref:ATP-grasp domain-containing protein n=1 Tax=Micromonospora auratinigra TaxID=261654 RepID=A0A1A8Z5G3_9ACTN|nr:ATP-grasp domain-containing protein [Micromonospora auratinigra]SBT39094.1 ATP-grasp domain-containing protein [Micromonospora auratinigra]